MSDENWFCSVSLCSTVLSFNFKRTESILNRFFEISAELTDKTWQPGETTVRLTHIRRVTHFGNFKCKALVLNNHREHSYSRWIVRFDMHTLCLRRTLRRIFKCSPLSPFTCKYDYLFYFNPRLLYHICIQTLCWRVTIITPKSIRYMHQTTSTRYVLHRQMFQTAVADITSPIFNMFCKSSLVSILSSVPCFCGNLRRFELHRRTERLVDLKVNKSMISYLIWLYL